MGILDQPMGDLPQELPEWAEPSINAEMERQAKSAGRTLEQFMQGDGPDVLQQLTVVMMMCERDTLGPHGEARPLLAIQRFSTRRMDVYEQRAGWRVEDPVQISNHYRRKIAQIWNDANDMFPSKPQLAKAAAWRLAKKRGTRFWEAWKQHHTQWDSLDQPVTNDPDAVTLADVVTMYPAERQGTLDMDWAFEKFNLTDEHRLIAQYLSEDPQPTQREILRRLNDDDGIVISIGTVNNRIKDIRAALTSFMERKRAGDGTDS